MVKVPVLPVPDCAYERNIHCVSLSLNFDFLASISLIKEMGQLRQRETAKTGMLRVGHLKDYYFIYLCNCVLSLDDGEDSLLLDGRRVFETEGVDAAEHFLLESHVVKIINFQFPVRFEKFLFFY